MHFVETSECVTPNCFRQEFEDVADSFLDDVGGLRTRDRAVEENEELPERRLVHDVDLAQLYDQEVEDGTSRGNRPILLSGCVDLRLSFRRDRQLLGDLLGRLLRVLQDQDQLFVVD